MIHTGFHPLWLQRVTALVPCKKLSVFGWSYQWLLKLQETWTFDVEPHLVSQYSALKSAGCTAIIQAARHPHSKPEQCFSAPRTWAALHSDAVWTGPSGSVRRTCSVVRSHLVLSACRENIYSKRSCGMRVFTNLFIQVFDCIVGIHLSRAERKVLLRRYLNFLSLAKLMRGTNFNFCFGALLTSHDRSVFLERKIGNLLR